MAPGGHLEIGVAASLTKAVGTLDYAQRLARTRAWELSAFAQAQAGFTRSGSAWKPDASAVAGARLTW